MTRLKIISANQHHRATDAKVGKTRVSHGATFVSVPTASVIKQPKRISKGRKDRFADVSPESKSSR